MAKKAAKKTKAKHIDKEGLPARLRRLRLERGLSQRELAAPGISYAYISRIEAGTRNPSVKALRKLAEKLGVGVDYLESGREALVLTESDPEYETIKVILEALRIKPEPTELEREVVAFLGEAEELRRPLARYLTARETARRKLGPLTRAIENYAKVSAAMAVAEKELRGALMNARGGDAE